MFFSNNSISPARFKILAKDIFTAFPTEDESIYYDPYRKVNNQKISAKGKLYDRFAYVRKILIQDGILVIENPTRTSENVNDFLEPSPGSSGTYMNLIFLIIMSCIFPFKNRDSWERGHQRFE